MKAVKKIENYLKYFVIYLISFLLNYVIFIFLMLFAGFNPVWINLINLISWIISMVFIFYIDKKYVPDLVDENNSSELFKFILIRLLSLIVETLIIYVFIIILKQNYYIIKMISLIMLFVLNEFYVKYIQFK